MIIRRDQMHATNCIKPAFEGDNDDRTCETNPVAVDYSD